MFKFKYRWYVLEKLVLLENTCRIISPFHEGFLKHSAKPTSIFYFHKIERATFVHPSNP